MAEGEGGVGMVGGGVDGGDEVVPAGVADGVVAGEDDGGSDALVEGRCGVAVDAQRGRAWGDARWGREDDGGWRWWRGWERREGGEAEVGGVVGGEKEGAVGRGGREGGEGGLILREVGRWRAGAVVLVGAMAADRVG